MKSVRHRAIIKASALSFAVLSAVILIGCAGGGSAASAQAPYKFRASRGDTTPELREPREETNTEEYKNIVENQFLKTIDHPLSTLSIDVDTASYANVRRFLNDGQLPPKDAVRIEECVNYFPYAYPEPPAGKAFSFASELSVCPWNQEHKLLLIGLKAKKIDSERLPPSNLVFLIDVSGSMYDPRKLPLLQEAFKLLVSQLREQDTVSIVVYAGAAGLVLPPTSGEQKLKITRAIESLTAGGSTAGGAGIRLAYDVARKNFLKQGNNRVILATDGDFNVGASSEGELVRLIEDKRAEGVFLSVLGFGAGNLKDSKMEMLADKGNGNFSYIDSLSEAKKVLVTQMGGTLVTIAKDVKLQVEFNPRRVASYRLLGYENRVLAAEDFTDDTKDAGDLGSGHTVTVFYELDMTDSADGASSGTRYTTTEIKPEADSDELLFIKFRAKTPTGSESREESVPVAFRDIPPAQTSADFRFASSVVEFCLLLRDSAFKGSADFNSAASRAKEALGEDAGGYRAEFLTLIDKAKRLSR
ncbi:MAG: VWA domain-containing protein [Spirochaetales bacterium]|nr:VWA domain-containing protein [Spirochaetales bacterium]